MERLELSKTLREYCHNEKDKKSQGDGLDVRFRADYQWADEGSENLCSYDFQAQKMQTQRGQQIKTLPEEMVEKILAMVPFPYVFKARVLSKSWLARLSSIPTLVEEEKKRLAILFQKQVSEWSPNWKTYCPIPQRTYCIANEEDLFAYDRTSHTLLRLPSLSFLPKNLFGGYCILLIEGALLLLWSFVSKEDNTLFLELVVANVLTRTWKKLPTRRFTSGEVYLSHTFEAYKVIKVSGARDFLEIYDSTTATWRSMKLAPALKDFSAANPEERLEAMGCVEGVLYFVTFLRLSVQTYARIPNLKVFAVQVNDETSVEEVNIVAEVDMTGKHIKGVTPVFWNANLLLFLEYDSEGTQLVKIDLGSGKLLGVAPCRFDLGDRMRMSVASDGNCLLLQRGLDQALLTYDLHEDKWGSLLYPFTINAGSDYRWIPSSFQPGLSPFGARWIPSSFQPGLNSFVAV